MTNPNTSEACNVKAPGPMTRRLWWLLAMTGGFMVVEVLGGWLSGSLALLADAGHMLTDVGAIGLAIFSASIARRPADSRRTFGYQRYEILAALVNGAALFGIAGWVVVEAIGRLRHPPGLKSGLFLAVAATGLVVNLVGIAIIHRGSDHSMNVRAVYLHVLGDALGSVGALLAAGVVVTTGWTLADPIASILLSLLILAGAWRLVRESTDVLLEGVPRSVSMPEVRRRMLDVRGVTGVHDLHVWTLGSGMIAMSGHAVAPMLEEHPGVLEGIRSAMSDLGIGHVTIQLEVEGPCEVLEVASHRHPH